MAEEIGHVLDWWIADGGYLHERVEVYQWVKERAKEEGKDWWERFRGVNGVIGVEKWGENTVIVVSKIESLKG